MPRFTTRLRYSLARLLVKSSALTIVPPWVVTSVLNPTFRSLTIDGYQKSSAMFACISTHAFSFPEAQLRVYEDDSEDAQAIDNHSLNQLLRNPMPNTSEVELLATTIVYCAIGGNAYWHKVRNKAGQVVQLRPFHAGHIIPIPGGEDWIQRYDYDQLGMGGSSETLTPIAPADIIHFKWPSPDPSQPWMSQPPVLSAAIEVDADVEASRYVFALLHNDAIPRMVVTVPQDRPMDDDEYRRFKEQWRERYGGTSRGEVAVLEAGAKVERMGLNLQELAFDALAKVPESRIASALRVPPIIAGLNVGLEKSTYANYAEARKAYTQDTLMPLWANFASKITASLLPEFKRDRGLVARFDTSRVAALQEDQTAKYKRITDAYKVGLIKRNEGRRALGFPDDAGGDTYYSIPAKPTPALTDASAPKTMLLLSDGTMIELPSGATRVVEKAQQSPIILTQASGQSAEQLAEQVLKHLGRPLKVGDVVETSVEITDEITLSAEPDIKASLESSESSIERAMLRYLRGQYRRAAQGVRSAAKADTLDESIVEQLELDLGPEAQRIMKRYYVPIAELAFSDAEIALDVAIAFDVENKQVQKVLDELALLVTRITDTTREDIRALIGKQAAEGWSIEQLAKELIAAGAVSSKVRARMIARTETASAYSKASILAYKLSDVVESIEWIATIDADTCEQCKALNGETTKLDKAFSDGTASPPRHPNCRCALAPIVKK